MSAMPSTDLAEWYPLVVASGVPTPRTEIVAAEVDLTWLLDGVRPEGFDAFAERLTSAADSIGYPLFLRTGYGSGKHQYLDTCRVDSRDALIPHVSNLVLWSHTVDLMGLPTETWVLRELLDVDAPFVAFHGMPVAKERRYFLGDDGKVSGHHPYWPPFAVADGDPERDGVPLADEVWRGELDALNRESADEVAELTALTEQVGRVVPGSWSVDWLWSPSRGWVCIDLAHFATSFVWAEYPTAPEPPPKRFYGEPQEWWTVQRPSEAS